MTRYWFSCPRFTVEVHVSAGVITWAAPIVRRFIGQRLENLRRWAAGFGAVRMEEL